MLDLAGNLNQLTHKIIIYLLLSLGRNGPFRIEFFKKNPTTSIESINYMINMDMVDLFKEDKSLAIYGGELHLSLSKR